MNKILSCLALVIAATAGCSGVSNLGEGDGPIVVMEVERFRCAAEEGLGCGSRLAPALARLDQLPGVVESRTDWEGRHVLIRLAPDATVDDVVIRATRILGTGSRRLAGAAESGQLASFRRGDPWMRSAETIRLSHHEASVLGARFARSASDRAGLDDGQRRKLEAILTEEIGKLFEWMHASGRDPEDVKKPDLKPTEHRIRNRCLEFASAAQTDAIIQDLSSAIGMCDEENR
ncbi:MAG TPA: hypothetical protein VJU16_03755 [Planctomycetota bacterium]|nr:hypothetical protein [Planctomycetota bacterium]